MEILERIREEIRPFPSIHTSPPRLEKKAHVDLPEKPQAWGPAIFSVYQATFPYLNSKSATLNVLKMDEKEKFLLGHLSVGDDARSMHLPVIVKQGKLDPMDIFFDDEGTFHPAVEWIVQDYFSNPGPFSTIAPLREPGHYPEFMIRKQASLLPEAKESFMLKIAHPWVRHQLESKYGDSIRFMEKAETAKTETEKAAHVASLGNFFSSDKRPEILGVTRTATDTYYLIANVRSRMHEKTMSTMQLRDYLKSISDWLLLSPDDAVRLIDENGEYIFYRARLVERPTFSKSDLLSAAVNITEFGRYLVADMSAYKIHGGLVFTAVTGFEGQPLPYKLFIGMDGKYSFQREMAGIRSQQEFNISTTEPRPRFKGFFIIPSTMEVTEPFQIFNKEVRRLQPHEILYVHTLNANRPVALTFSDRIDRIVPVTDSRFSNEFVVSIPKTAQFVEIKEHVNLQSMSEKLATGMPSISTNIEVFKRTDGTLVLSAPWMKAAQELPSFRAEIFLAGLGLDPNKLHEALEKSRSETFFNIDLPEAAERETISIKQASLPAIEPPIEELAFFPIIAAGLKKISASCLDTLKEYQEFSKVKFPEISKTADIDEPQTVDRVLSLNFLSPETMNEIVEGIPQYKEVLSKMAYLLFLARIGLDEIPAQPLEGGLRKLGEVLQKLFGISQTKDLGHIT